MRCRSALWDGETYQLVSRQGQDADHEMAGDPGMSTDADMAPATLILEAGVGPLDTGPDPEPGGRNFARGSLDFRFRSIGREVGGTCFAIRHLPDYPIAAIRTGQYTGGGQVWEGNFDITEQLDDGEVAP